MQGAAIAPCFAVYRRLSVTDLEIRPLQPDEIDAAGDLIARVFAEGDARRYERLLYHRVTLLPRRENFQLSDYRAGFLGDELVTVVRVDRRILGYGHAWLHTAGITDVATLSDYRRRGYSEAVVRDALTYIAESGAHLAFLRDPVGYYHRYGFSPVLPDYRLTFHVQDALQLRAALSVRDAQPEDAPALAKLYHQNWSGRVTFLRSQQHWQWLLTAGYHPIEVVCTPDGTVAGYIWQDAADDDRVEVVADSPDATAALMVRAARRAQSTGQTIIRWSIPPDDAIIACARLLLPVTLSADYYPRSGWMARPVNARGLVKRLLPELEAMQRYTGVQSAASPVLKIHASTVEVGTGSDLIQLAHQDFIQILFGTLRPAMLAMQHRLDQHQVNVLEQLFPPRVAAIAPGDWF